MKYTINHQVKQRPVALYKKHTNKQHRYQGFFLEKAKTNRRNKKQQGGKQQIIIQV